MSRQSIHYHSYKPEIINITLTASKYWLSCDLFCSYSTSNLRSSLQMSGFSFSQSRKIRSKVSRSFLRLSFSTFSLSCGCCTGLNSKPRQKNNSKMCKLLYCITVMNETTSKQTTSNPYFQEVLSLMTIPSFNSKLLPDTLLILFISQLLGKKKSHI